MEVTPLTVCSSVNMDFTLAACVGQNLEHKAWDSCMRVGPSGNRAIEIAILDNVHAAGHLYSTHANFAQFMDEVYVSLGPVGAPLNPDTMQEAVNHIVVQDLSKEVMKAEDCALLDADAVAMIFDDIYTVEWRVHNSAASAVRQGKPHRDLGHIVDDIKQILWGSVGR